MVMKMFSRKPKRYVARNLSWTLIGVQTGVVDDTTPDKPSTLDRTEAGWEYITTLSRAKSIARWANRNEGR